MEIEKNVLFIFCEGAHDVAFCRLAFKELLQIKKTEWLFKDYPSPLDKLFLTNISKYINEDLTLDMAKKFFLPDYTLIHGNTIILLCNSGGITRTNEVVTPFLQSFIPLLNEAKIFRESKEKPYVKSARYLFLYDADDSGITKRINWWEKEFAEIKGVEDWKIGDLQIETFGAIADDKAVFVWANEQTCTGTLEDILLPMFEKSNQSIATNASVYIDSNFLWANNVADTAKRKKAIITALGQKEKPGGSMNVIIDQAKLLTKKSLEESAIVNEFINIVNKML